MNVQYVEKMVLFGFQRIKMNKKQIAINRMKALEQIKRSSQFATRFGCAKCWKGTSKKHFMTISDIVWRLINEYNYEILTEAEFVGGGRADIFYLDNNKNPGVIEVLNSETNERFNIKLESYPFPITKVRVDEYSEDWCL